MFNRVQQKCNSQEATKLLHSDIIDDVDEISMDYDRMVNKSKKISLF